MLPLVPLTSMTLRESPRWLINQGKNLQAGRVLAWLRGPNFNMNTEQMEIKAQLASEEKLTFAADESLNYKTCAPSSCFSHSADVFPTIFRCQCCDLQWTAYY